MLKFQYEQPLQISGVIINEEALQHLLYMQTGNFWLSTKIHQYNNEGVNDYLTDLSEIINHLLGNMLECDSRDKPKVLEQIERAYLLRKTFEKLKLPDEFLKPQVPDHKQ